MPRRVVLVSHTHWDREWYRTAEGFRARLVDCLDALLDLFDTDLGYRFTLDGQVVPVEDYLALRPWQAERLRTAGRTGRLAVGPWYTQTDTVMPHGESLVRNLAEGRRAALDHGLPVSVVGYLPDSFGYPAQLPQVLVGFGLDSFVYWRGDTAATAGEHTWRWASPDGSSVLAVRLPGGYWLANDPLRDPEVTAQRVLAARDRVPGDGDQALLLHGGDHQPPDPLAGALAERVAALTGWEVTRGTLDDAVAPLARDVTTRWQGELTGAAAANLLSGVLSTRVPVKLAHRRLEHALLASLEPFAAICGWLGADDESAALRSAWRTLLACQAHDSLPAASADAVADSVLVRLGEAAELAENTYERLLERLTGCPTDRRTAWTDHPTVAVVNPSPRPRTDVVRLRVDGFPLYGQHAHGVDVNPFLLAPFVGGLLVDGTPVRVVTSEEPGRTSLTDVAPALDLEWVAADVPAFGWRAVTLAPGPPAPDEVDEGRTVTTPELSLTVGDDGTLALTAGGRTWEGLLALTDEGDRGDAYDAAEVADDPGATLQSVAVTRRRHPSGIAVLEVQRRYLVPAGLTADRTARRAEQVPLLLRLCARVAPGVPRVDVDVTLVQAADDHRVRLHVPADGTARAAATFGTLPRRAGTDPDRGGHHRPPDTFCQQGWSSSSGLTLVAPGLYEAALTGPGTLAVTLLRGVGRLSLLEHPWRSEIAGPGQALPGAQGHGTVRARLALLPTPGWGDAAVAQAAAEAESALAAVGTGTHPLLPPGVPALAVQGAEVSALLPSPDGDGVVLRLLNRGEEPTTALVRTPLPVASLDLVRLDGQPAGDVGAPQVTPGTPSTVSVEVPAHALRSLRLRPQRRSG